MSFCQDVLEQSVSAFLCACVGGNVLPSHIVTAAADVNDMPETTSNDLDIQFESMHMYMLACCISIQLVKM